MVTKHFALLPATGFVLILLSGLALVNWGTILQPPVARAQPPVTAMDETTRLAQVGRQRGAAPSSGADQDWRAYGSQDFAITPGSGSRSRGKPSPLIMPGDIGILPGSALGGKALKAERIQIGPEH